MKSVVIYYWQFEFKGGGLVLGLREDTVHMHWGNLEKKSQFSHILVFSKFYDMVFSVITQ